MEWISLASWPAAAAIAWLQEAGERERRGGQASQRTVKRASV
jgi:hypothetical protein